LGGNQSHKVCVQKYEFTKSGSNYYYKSRFKLLGFVVPKEYNYDENKKNIMSIKKIIHLKMLVLIVSLLLFSSCKKRVTLM